MGGNVRHHTVGAMTRPTIPDKLANLLTGQFRLPRRAMFAGLGALVLAVAAFFAVPAALHRALPTESEPETVHTPLHAQGGEIVDVDGHRVVLSGVNWF